jgi:tRNA A-37 threonylcarbamoyl transferase component Bud32
LQSAGILYRDISINNLIINEDKENSSWLLFLIDLNLAIKDQRDSVTGASGKTRTRAFIAIGSLLGEKHSFIYNLKSFF